MELKMESVYSTNTEYLDIVNKFFKKLSHELEYKGLEEAAFGNNEKVRKFRVPGFNPEELEGKTLEEWQKLPIGVVSSPECKLFFLIAYVEEESFS